MNGSDDIGRAIHAHVASIVAADRFRLEHDCMVALMLQDYDKIDRLQRVSTYEDPRQYVASWIVETPSL